MLGNLNDDLMSLIFDHLDMRSIGAVATAFKKKGKETYHIYCRTCGNYFINKLGLKRRLRCKMLKESNYMCPKCVKDAFEELEVRVRTLCYGLPTS